MKILRTTQCIALLLLANAASAGPGKVLVEFQNPDKFADVKDRQFRTAPEKNQNLAQLRSWCEKRGATWIPEGQTLKIQFVDIDLAGDYEPWLSTQMNDIRIVKDIYPPRLKFRFQVLAADNSVIREGEKDIRDLGFMTNVVHHSLETLQHEKRMLEKWLRAEFQPK